MLHDTLADILNVIKTADKLGKKNCVVYFSKLGGEVLRLLKEKGYISSYEFVNDGKSGKFRVELSGKIINTGVVKPRFSVKINEFEKWEKRFLPSKDIGYLIITTPNGVVDHRQAKESKIGGKLLGYVY